MRSPAFLLYEDTARTDTWLKLMLGGILVMFLVLGGVLLFQDKEDAFGMFGIAVFYALLFKIIMPQRYQIYSDKVRIVLGGPFAWNIPFSTIKEVRSASGVKCLCLQWGPFRHLVQKRGGDKAQQGLQRGHIPVQQRDFSGAGEQGDEGCKPWLSPSVVHGNIINLR